MQLWELGILGVALLWWGGASLKFRQFESAVFDALGCFLTCGPCMGVFTLA